MESGNLDLTKLRVGKVIFFSDADADGCHIDTLLCGLLYKLMPGLFAAGKVYKVDAPLFTTQIGLKRYYAATKDKLLAKLPPSAKPNITRLKGLGEANADLLREIAFNPETRKLRRILPVKGKRLQKFLSILGAESDYRKELLGVTK